MLRKEIKLLINEAEQCKFEKVKARKNLENMEEDFKQLKNVLKGNSTEIVLMNEELTKNKKVLDARIDEKTVIKKLCPILL